MDRKQLIERLMATFLGELDDHVRAISEDLLALEKGGTDSDRAARFKSLFRAFHSLKGAARSVSVGVIETACQSLEAILSAARDGAIPTDANLFAILFSAADALEEASMRLREQQDLAGSPLDALLPTLDSTAGEAQTAPRPQAQTAAPPSEPSAPEPNPPLPPPPAREKPAPSRPAAVDFDRSASGSAFVRVPAEKLDAMLTRSGELLVARQAVESWSRELAAIHESVARWIGDWRVFERPLRALVSPPGHSPERSALPRRAAQTIASARDRLDRLEVDLDRLNRAVAHNRRQFGRAVTQLDEEVRRVRMLPFAEACLGLERAARDIAVESGKQVEVVIEGGEVELDRSVLEGLKDPLMHLVRNAVDHGVESPEVRRAAGKPATARITVRAALLGSQVEVVVDDDGAGLDLDALRQKAVGLGLPESLSEREISELIFVPGFSTARIITSISGRGVGLDVVKSRLESLHGTIEWTSSAGQGTRFTLAVPLTLTMLRALLVEAAGQTFAVASTNVLKVVRIDPAAVRSLEGRPVLALGGTPLPLASLPETLGYPTADSSEARMGVVVAANERRMVFAVESLLAEQEIIVKGLGARIKRVRCVSGATILHSGRIALVFSAAGLVRAAMGRSGGAARFLTRREEASAVKRRLLVIDDSVTTRTLEKSILEAAGYEVATAVDGDDAWRYLQENPVDLVVSDIEMPRMDGFALTETIRGSPRLAAMPVVLFTSRASERDRARGIEVGAHAYIVKGAFDQKDLLETIAQLL